MTGFIALEDGRYFPGESFGAPGRRAGEVVFNTSLTGYQEVLTDPSYKGQIVALTYPLIGNYGVNPEDEEAAGPQVEGFLVREYCPYPSSWRSRETLGDYLARHGVVALQGVDTRALTRHIREAGAMRAALAAGEGLDPEELVEAARRSPGLVGRDLAREVSGKTLGRWNPEGGAREFRVAAYDFGAKRNIWRLLDRAGCEVQVLPAWATAAEALALEPDGIFLSNGPGDPAALDYAVAALRELIGRKPIFGICLGHQLLGLALGGRTFKLKFGHRGGNQPVREQRTGKVEITAQNHGFAVDAASLPPEAEETHLNLNDRTNEGLAHRQLPVFSVQYHPEAAPGPHDSRHLFGRFVAMLRRQREGKSHA